MPGRLVATARDTDSMRPIHRDDGELCGFVQTAPGSWRAVAVFGGLLQEADSEHAAEEIVRMVGLPALAERWLLSTTESDDEEVVCLQEASPAGVTVALGYYSMPGVPTRRISRGEIDDGSCRLRRDVAVPS
jgi:hypothetical protein